MYDLTHWTRGLGRNRRFYIFLRYTLGLWVRAYFSYRCKTYVPKSDTVLVLSNHTTDCDPFFLSVMLPRHVRYVAGDRLLALKPWGKVISFLENPIPRKKGADSAETVRYIEENLKAGISVGLFPEGVRSINGRTGFISPRTAKLAKESGAGLLLCRLHGGYLVSPIWAKRARRGPVWGEVAREYTPTELAAMSEEELCDAIRETLAVDAFAEQRQAPQRYRGRALAEGIENALFVCPKCGALGVLRGEGDTLSCEACGTKTRYGEDGFFADDSFGFRDLLAWELWQREELAKRAALWRQSPETPVYTRRGVTLKTDRGSDSAVVCAQAELALYSDRIVFSGADGGITLPFTQLLRLSNYRSTRLLLSCRDGSYYEASCGGAWPVFLLLALWRCLTGKAYL